MTDAAIVPENRQENTRRLLRYGGWAVFGLLVAYLFLAPTRTGLVTESHSLPNDEPAVPAATVATEVHPADPNLFTAEAMGDSWPFNGISKATVECRKGVYAVLVADNGTTYALDAKANMAARTGTEDFIRIDAIRRKSDARSGGTISLDPLLARGAALCGN